MDTVFNFLFLVMCASGCIFWIVILMDIIEYVYGKAIKKFGDDPYWSAYSDGYNDAVSEMGKADKRKED